ncbi:hypothetical protein E2320_008619, partial [Naja naja]
MNQNALRRLSFARFKGVKPVSGIWSAEATFAMKQLVQNKVVAIKVTDKKMNTSVVEITDESVTPSINISKYLLELGYAVEEAPILLKPIEAVKETNGENQEPVNWSWVTLTAKQVVNVMVSVLYNPSKFYCQLLNKDDLNALKELNLSLAKYCEKTKPNVSQIIKGKNGAEVELIDNSNSIPMISEILIKKHLAFKKDLILNPNTLPGTSTSMQWTMPTFSIGDTLSALVLDVVDPGLFYVIPKEMKGKNQNGFRKAQKLTIELADYCYAENDNVFNQRLVNPVVPGSQ